MQFCTQLYNKKCNFAGQSFPEYCFLGSFSKAHDRIIWAADWSSDARFFATGARDKAIKIWPFDPENPQIPGSPFLEMKNLHAPVTALSFIPDSHQENLVNGGDVPFGTKVRTSPGASTMQHQYLLAVGYESGILEIWALSKSETDDSMNAEQVCGLILPISVCFMKCKELN
jgi:WD40 repeat protein